MKLRTAKKIVARHHSRRMRFKRPVEAYFDPCDPECAYSEGKVEKAKFLLARAKRRWYNEGLRWRKVWRYNMEKEPSA